MTAALGLAARGLGAVWPNPAVGCVLVGDSSVVGRGWTQAGGRPHAETEALQRAGKAARGATAFVTLEPCCHHGETPPCTQALVDAGVARVVAAVEDPDPRVSGRGLAALRDAGLTVASGLCAETARSLNAGYFKRIEHGQPLVTLKLASTLDGKIATHSGRSQWITGEAARAAGHLLRVHHDAVLVGVGTAVADDPELTCRVPGLVHRSPVRIVLDPRLRLPLTHRLVVQAAAPTWLVALGDADSARRRAFEDCGIEVVTGAGEAGQFDLAGVLKGLAERGLTRILVEGGSHTAAALLRARLVDRIEWFRSASVMGGDGIPALAPFGVDDLADMPGFVRTGIQPFGKDLLETFEFQT
ncbi:MAG TPA: bifunctional diaminohydroxyphosphoribosylaminopyrimidine deaminase/5-amino-6-(5-phosphoribosylamino)uracil reductase RibD [Alphaproteobacteria bacterium]|nr:bifunctional diaminohydroxyphosphoribosylaminopyrimidine deaminase/5-amino-6-(5-phosphoribosylamino)uracil reductase RibD [Alphaproteobacteria bacterium]